MTEVEITVGVRPRDKDTDRFRHRLLLLLARPNRSSHLPIKANRLPLARTVPGREGAVS
jgi:hypothetical protein